ncbi:UvrD-helicase domain-containing protein [Kitasatospora sp. NPDC101801]|uniref:UvrD-helicase domain-containing protein n=1 Tax=Kitasatospora sp. NPDC101801 TaxID=3364103 RepID=UPI0037FF6BF6
MFDPTPEQAAALAGFAARQDLVMQAGAGTGKTTTLRLLADSTPRRGLYLAFNKSVADEAARTFPDRVRCATAHSLAFRAVAAPYQHRLGGSRIPTHAVATALGITRPLSLGEGKVLEPWTLAHITLRTVRAYCWSADTELTEDHVPLQRGAEEPRLHAEVARAVLPLARRAWQDISAPAGTQIRFEHDHYLKMWQLTNPRLPGDYLLLDEAQDTNPVLESVIAAQHGHTQLVLVGDSAQQIYAWRGARDIMNRAPGTQLTLSQSFRFGPALADEANLWLAATGSTLRLSGHAGADTVIGPLPGADAVLCRTNTATLTEAIHHLSHNRSVAITGGGTQLRALALAARDLRAGRGTHHPELSLFM